MNITDEDNIDATWHFRVLNNCDQVLQRLSAVMNGLRRQRRRTSIDPVNLGIYRETWNPVSAGGESTGEPQSA